MQSLTLSPQQVLDRDLGVHGATVGFATVQMRPGHDDLARLDEAVRAAGFDQAVPTLSVVGVHWDDAKPVVREGDWSRTPLPRRYVLEGGEWADDAHEVVVAVRDPATAPRIGQRLDMLSGRLPLEVVGVAVDRFTKDTPTLLIGPGTWEQVASDTADAFPAVSAYPVVFWDGSRDRLMVRTVSDALGTLGVPVSGDLKTLVSGSLLRAPDLLADAPRPVDEGNHFAYAIPSVTAGLVGALLAGSLLLPSLARNRTQLRDAGMAPTSAAALPVFAAAPALLAGVVVGVILGVLTAAASRPLVHAWHDQPLSPLAVPLDPLIRMTPAVLVLLAALAYWQWRAGVNRSGRRERSTSATADRGLREVRRWIAVLATVGCLGVAPLATSPTPAMLLAACVVVGVAALAPDLLALVLRRLPDRNLRLRLAVRQLEQSSTSGQTVLLTAVVTGCSIAFTVLLSTMIATMDGRQIPSVLPGQVMVADRATPVLPVPAPALRAVRSSDAEAKATSIPLAFAAHGIEGEPGSRVVTLDDLSGYVMAVDTVAQAEALLGREWDESLADVLSRGGVVRWLEGVEDPGDGSSKLTVRGAPTVTLASIDRQRPGAGWAMGRSGITLVSTLERAGLPISRGAIVLAHTPAALDDELRATLRAAGLDEDLVTGYATPPPPIPNAALIATALLLALTSVAMVAGASTSRVRALRPTVAQLLANGVPASWSRKAILFQEGLLLLLGLSLGGLAGVIPVLISIPRFEDLWVVSVPWEQILGLVGACVLGCGAAALAAAHRVRPQMGSLG